MDWNKVNTITGSELHKADIILVDGPSGYAVAIEWGTWSPVSHAALCLGYNEFAESLDNGPTISSKPNCGPKSSNLAEWLAQLDHALVVRYNDFDATAQDAVCKHAVETVARNTPYDKLKIAQLSQRTVAGTVISAGTSQAGYWLMRRSWNKAAKWTDNKTVAPGYPEADDKAFICSEFVVRMYELAGYPIVDAACWVAPCDFIDLKDGKPYCPDSRLSVIGKLK